LTGLKIVTA